MRSTKVSRRRAGRLLGSMWRQRTRSLLCPDAPSLAGQRALVTGGTEGIGLATARGLLRRGARVTLASRNSAKGERALAELGAEAAVADFLSLDLSDLAAVVAGAAHLRERLRGERLDVLVCNAGLWPRRHGLSPQGHELAFATNVLGHFLLIRLLASDLLNDGARVVLVTGDIYILANDCTSRFSYRTPLGGMLAYCRSKLGNLWQARELQRRHPGLQVRAVHPGVVATNLGGERAGLAAALSRRVLLEPELGAQTSLYCATQTGIPPGAYIHNVKGLMQLAADDPAADAGRAEAFWEHCEALCSGHLPARAQQG